MFVSQQGAKSVLMQICSSGPGDAFPGMDVPDEDEGLARRNHNGSTLYIVCSLQILLANRSVFVCFVHGGMMAKVSLFLPLLIYSLP